MRTYLVIACLSAAALWGCGDDSVASPPATPMDASGGTPDAMPPTTPDASIDATPPQIDGMVVMDGSAPDAMIDMQTRMDCSALCSVVAPCFTAPEAMCIETCASLIDICSAEERMIIRECSMISECMELGICFMRVGCLSSLGGPGV